MSNIKIPAITRLSNMTNTASNLQQAITGAANFYDVAQKELERKRREKEQKKEENKQEKFEFNPDEIETLVYRTTNKTKDTLEERTLITEEKEER